MQVRSVKPCFELVAAEGDGTPFARLGSDALYSGQVRFDNVPPGKYLLRMGELDDTWIPERVLAEVEVREGHVTEISVKLP